METILEKNGHIKRYATKEEMSKCIECLVDELWQDVIREDARFVDTINLEKGEVEFKKEVRLEYEEQIGYFGIVDYFTEINCSLITTSCISEVNQKNPFIMNLAYRFINIQGTYSTLEDDAEAFDFHLDILIKKAISLSNNHIGRPNKPTDNSIEKTLIIRDSLMRNENFGVDFVCKQTGLPKSTYYKTLKWLQKNSIIGIS